MILSSLKKYIQKETVQTREPTSENLFQSIGGSTNFLLDTNGEQHQFKLNGSFVGASGKSFLDGALIFEYNATITDVQLYLFEGGLSGDFEIDLLYSPTKNGPFTSIFSTKPKINFAATTPTFIGVGETVTNCIAPVLSTLNVVKGGWIYLQVTSTQIGNAYGGVIVRYQPR